VTPDVLADILAGLELVVFERLPDGVFLRVAPGRPPEWFSRLLVDGAPDAQTTLAAAFPFLERFLPEAEAAWRHGDLRRMRSDPFTVTDPAGTEIGLLASAIAVGNRRFLVLEKSADVDERQRMLQRAREDALAHEDHVRRTGALMTPVTAALTLARQLGAETGLSAGQRQLVSELTAQLAGLATAIETLAPLPKGVTRVRR
jgi:hypothetical protein